MNDLFETLEPARPPAPPPKFDRLIEVAVDRPMHRTFTYGVERGQPPIPLGAYVQVPFGRSVVPGFCIGERPLDSVDASKLKAVVKILDDTDAALTPELLKLARWISNHYACPLGVTLKFMLPMGVKNQTANVRKIRFVATDFDANQLMIHASSLATKKKKQSAILRTLAEAPRVEHELKDLLERADSNLPALKALEASHFVRIIERSQWAVESARPSQRSVGPTLNAEQVVAFEAIRSAMSQPGPHKFLLQGVTSSGKTEIYLRALETALAQGKQGLVLIPEIALTPQTAERFQSRLGRERVAVLSAEAAAGLRAEIWRAIRAGKIDVVIGARSALFAPLPRLGVIVVDEEHDSSYKSPAAPRYHARDAALALAEISKATIILGTATPCFESYHAAQKKQMRHLILRQRATPQPLPPVFIVDLNRENEEQKRYTYISRALRAELDKTLSRGEQAILFLNRRGYATVNQCLRCGSTEKCKNCDVTLTSHRESNMLVCHYCNFKKPVSQECPVCGAPGLKHWGLGTERVAGEIAAMFPRARLARMDSDTMKRPGQYAQTLGEFRACNIDVLIGTQMIAKGLDFPAVTLVGVILADTTLHIPDFRNRERTFQLLAQVSGRAGRSELGGRVIVQTRLPKDPSVLCAAEHDFEAFYLEEMKERSAFRYPPYSCLARIVFTAKDAAQLTAAADSIAQALNASIKSAERLKSVEILGPAECTITKIRNRSRKHILLKAASHDQLSELLNGAIAESLLKLRGVDALIDVDPLSML